MINRRNYGLDALRILLCLTIVFFHYSVFWNCGGSVAVDGFFVLSGFLAVRSAEVTPLRSVSEYYWKKCWRLLPSLLLVWGGMLGVLAVRHMLDLKIIEIEHFLCAPAKGIGMMTKNCATWFIVCLIVFQMMFPWVFRYYGRKPFLWILGGVVLFAAFRSVSLPSERFGMDSLYYQISFRLWQFLLGMWGASWCAERWSGRWRFFLVGLACVLVFASSVVSRSMIGFWNYSFPAYLMTSCIFALCIASLWCVRLPELPSSILKVVKFGAGISYSLFLCHQPVINAMEIFVGRVEKCTGVDWQQEYPLLFYGLACCAALALSWILYQYVEVRWGGKMLKKR